MPTPASKRAVLRLAFGALAGLALTCHAQAPAAAVPPMNAELVKTGLYVIRGGGANTLLRFSANGLVLVDGKAPGNYRALMSQVRKVAKLVDLPVRALILTGSDEDRAGNAASFAAAKVQVFAQQNAARRLPVARADDARAALPVFTYDRDHTMRVGGVVVELRHLGKARTDGDSVVYFPDLKVVAVGDLCPAGIPVPDYAAGGSLVGWDAALAQLLALDFDLAMPSTGPALTRAGVVALKSKVDTLLARARTLARDGTPESEWPAKLGTGDPGSTPNLAGDDLTRFRAELTPPR